MGQVGHQVERHRGGTPESLTTRAVNAFMAFMARAMNPLYIRSYTDRVTPTGCVWVGVSHPTTPRQKVNRASRRGQGQDFGSATAFQRMRHHARHRHWQAQRRRRMDGTARARQGRARQSGGEAWTARHRRCLTGQVLATAWLGNAWHHSERRGRDEAWLGALGHRAATRRHGNAQRRDATAQAGADAHSGGTARLDSDSRGHSGPLHSIGIASQSDGSARDGNDRRRRRNELLSYG